MEIKGKLFIPYEFKKQKWFKRKPIPLIKSRYKFPPNTNAVFESNDGYYYFIRKDKYCKRRLEIKQRVSLIVDIIVIQ